MPAATIGAGRSARKPAFSLCRLPDRSGERSRPSGQRLQLAEALYATKRAVNRAADAAGFRTALYAGLDVVGPLYATKTELGAKFREIVAAEGVPAAVRWRRAQFEE
jgi:hypothetical protein